MKCRKAAAGLVGLLMACLLTGCATPPESYQRTDAYYVNNQFVMDDSPQIEVGRSVRLLDGLNHYSLSLPAKLLLLNWQVLDHRLRPGDRDILERYLELNQLYGVKIRHNQYAPIAEFRRLRKNKDVGAGYRYTLGLLAWLQYTLIPNRVFGGLPLIGGGDHFNPYTNTINVFSSDLTILLHEAGHAKDYVQHELKGTSFAVLRMLPGVDLIQEGRASTDAVRFLYCIDHREGELQAYRTLIPAFSTYVPGYVGGGAAVAIPVIVGGHLVGLGQWITRGRAMHEGQEDALPGLTRRDFLPPYCVPMHESEVASPAASVGLPDRPATHSPRIPHSTDERPVP